MKKQHLLAPGPTPIPSEALLAMARPILYHRSPAYEALFAHVREGLKSLFRTEHEVLMFTASGTGAMEAAVVNTLSPGDRALVVVGGKFGERWAELCQAYGVEVIPVEIEWGKALRPEQVTSALEQDPSIKAVFVTHSETSTGVLHDVRALAEVVKEKEALLIVDAITSLGVTEVETDAWGLDIVVAGSQKALMIPPGLAFCAVSKKTWAAVGRSKLPRFYFDFQATKKSQEKNQSPFTPAVSLVAALKEALDLIQAEGLEKVIARHKRLSRATLAGVEALGLEPFAERPSPAVTAVKAPEGIAPKEIVKAMRTKYGITIAGGQGKLKDTIFRIAHLGYADESDVILVLSTLERILSELGYPAKLGEGVRAAQEIFLKSEG
ncbi:MAG: alanine--glyoxylate aminotransferase family protein [candidate division NC10 bacterium]|nr:alanine--glyoxylate aminotransferase family protein [candidate division NC10 bacterium]